jgi:hypothetical protein
LDLIYLFRAQEREAIKALKIEELSSQVRSIIVAATAVIIFALMAVRKKFWANFGHGLHLCGS